MIDAMRGRLCGRASPIDGRGNAGQGWQPHPPTWLHHGPKIIIDYETRSDTNLLTNQTKMIINQFIVPKSIINHNLLHRILAIKATCDTMESHEYLPNGASPIGAQELNRLLRADLL